VGGEEEGPPFQEAAGPGEARVAQGGVEAHQHPVRLLLAQPEPQGPELRRQGRGAEEVPSGLGVEPGELQGGEAAAGEDGLFTHRKAQAPEP